MRLATGKVPPGNAGSWPEAAGRYLHEPLLNELLLRGVEAVRKELLAKRAQYARVQPLFGLEVQGAGGAEAMGEVEQMEGGRGRAECSTGLDIA